MSGVTEGRSSVGPSVSAAGLEQVLARIDLGVIGVDSACTTVLFRNPKARELLGTEIDPATVESLFGHRLGSTRSSSASLLVGDWVRVGEMHVGYSVYDLPDGSHWIILRDVTDRLRVQRAAEGMTVANNLGYAFAGVAHELGNPINSVKMAATVLRDNLEAFAPEKRHDYLTEILSETNRMQEILRIMQAFIGLGSLDPVNAELGPECRKVMDLVARDASARGIELRDVFVTREPVYARIDVSAFRQVLMNLVSNALEAVSEVAKPLVSIDAFRGDKYAHVRVSDNGRGISREQQERLFFPFYSTRPGGMGFGLVIVKKLVSSMAGTVEVVSASGLGTSFEVLLPLARETSK